MCSFPPGYAPMLLNSRVYPITGSRFDTVASLQHTISYLVRIIDLECKTSFITKVWHDVHIKFATVKQLKENLIAIFEEKLPTLSESKCGYLERHTNVKRWTEDNIDLEAMYKTFSDKTGITIWCEGPSSEEQTSKRGKKKKSDDSGDSGTSKRSAREDSIDEIVQTLRESMERNTVHHNTESR